MRRVIILQRLAAQSRRVARALSRIATVALSLVVSASALASAPAPAMAATAPIVVTSVLDTLKTDGACTLREAILAANKDRSSSNQVGECSAGRGDDVIIIPAGTYTLSRTDNGSEDSGSTGDLDITGNVVFSATGPVTITAVSGYKDRIIHVLKGTVTLQGITLSGGKSPVDGGGIASAGALTVIDGAIVGNSAAGRGGGIFSTGALTLVNVTVSGNAARTSGGGLFLAGPGSASLNNITLARNTADSDANGSGDGGGIAVGGGVAGIQNSIVAGNADLSAATRHMDCSGSLASQGYALVQDTGGCALAAAVGNLTGVDPRLGPLQHNGGGTPTHALLTGSPAIDAGSPVACAPADQRGIARPSGSACDIGAYERVQVAPPIVIRVEASQVGTLVVGRLQAAPATSFTLSFYASPDCGDASPKSLLGTQVFTTGAGGAAYFSASLPVAAPAGQYVFVVATDPDGNVSSASRCVLAGPGNDAWVRALPLEPDSLGQALVSQFIDAPGQARWYKFRVAPGNKIVVELRDLPVNFDLTLYKDISATMGSLLSPETPQDLQRLDVEFAPDAFSPDAYSPDAYSPDAFSPDAYSPDAYSPDAYSPDAYSPDAYSPDAFSPDAYSPDAYSPDAFSPDAYSPDAFSPDAYSPDAYSPDAFSPDAYSSAQMRSVIGVSAFAGTASEGIQVNTWNNTGDYYVRVRGRNGAYAPGAPFQLRVVQLAGACAAVAPITTPASIAAIGGSYRTLIVMDLARMPGTSDEKATLQARLAALAARPEVAGVIVDVGADARVAAANLQADANPSCPYAKNLVAESIKGIADAYRARNPLENIVIVGSDDVIPFFRHPDQALLANERNYVPPVRDATASQASLRFGYVLSQDKYGARASISLKDDVLPIPDLATGRLVETASDAAGMIDAYLSTAGGVLPAPTSSLVTGYDFLEDAALAVQRELEAGIGAPAATLISPRDLSPQDPAAWTADQLKAAVLGQRRDVMFLAGHFSANSALAADYRTRLTTADVIASPANLVNALIFSAGCHSGYSIVDAHGVAGVTREPDWAQAFARKRATLIAGTGYQYGDTDFIEYSERLYFEFSRQLRAGSGPVSIGQALVEAKQAYLADTPQLRGIHEKVLLQATLFGLPMLRIDMPGQRFMPQARTLAVTSTLPATRAPGTVLGLTYADLEIVPTLTARTVQLTNIEDQAPVTALYLSGLDGVVSAPAEPVLPLELRNVGVAGRALRGVGFRGGDFVDTPNVLPLIGAATTEVRGVHAPFLSDAFYPAQPWSVNAFDAVAHDGAGATMLAVTPAQFRSSAPNAQDGTLRRFNAMRFRLYYSANTATYGGGSVPAAAAPPAIARVASAIVDGGVDFRISVVGNPAAGAQEVWVTYSALSGALAGQWRSLDLTQSPTDSTAWLGRLPLNGIPPQDARFIVQAANGVGLVGMATNLGAFFVPGVTSEPTLPTAVALQAPPAEGQYGSQVPFSAILTSAGAPLAGRRVDFSVGPQTRQSTTDANGRATVTLSLLGIPGELAIRAAFAGDETYIASSTSAPFVVGKQPTLFTLAPDPASGFAEAGAVLTATLTDSNGRRLGEKTVFLIVSGLGGTHAVAEITDYAGRVTLGQLPLPPGGYTIAAYFSGEIPLPSGVLTLDDERYTPARATASLALLNHPPVAAPDSASTAHGTPVAIAVLSNDADPDGDALSVSAVTQAAHGSVTTNGVLVTYTPDLNFSGDDVFSYTAVDTRGGTATALVTVRVAAQNRPPECASVIANIRTLWPPDKTFYPVSLVGGSDPDSDLLTLTITGIRQDEPVGGEPDGRILGPNLAEVRAERSGNTDGRVYHVFYTLADGRGGTCSGDARVGIVTHDQSGSIDLIDGGPLYDSTLAE